MKKLIGCFLLLLFCFGITSAAPTSCSGSFRQISFMGQQGWRLSFNEDLIPSCLPAGDLTGLGYTLKATSGAGSGLFITFGAAYNMSTDYDYVISKDDNSVNCFSFQAGDSFDLYLNGEQLPPGSSVRKPIIRVSSSQKFSAQNVFYDITGRKIANTNQAAHRLNLIRLPDGTMVKNLNFNRLR